MQGGATFAPMLRTVLPALLLLTGTLPTGQAGALAAQGPVPARTIEVRIEGLSNDTVYLANYYGNKLYYADTAVADARGTAVFRSAEGHTPGVYAVVAPGPKYFEVVVNEPTIVLQTKADDLMGGLRAVDSDENRVFLEYIRFLNARKADGDALRSRSETTADPIAKAAIKRQMLELDSTVKAYQRDLVAAHKGMLAAALVHMGTAVERDPVMKADGTMDSAATYYDHRAHYWDHFDLGDPRIVRVPVFANKLEEYMKRFPQFPDTINRAADELIARITDDEVFKYVVHTWTHTYETSDIMGMDAVFVHMAQNYYCPAPGRASRTPWMDDEKLGKLCERARKMAPLTIGSPAANLILPDTTEQRWVNMHALPQEYIVLVFWDPHCGVCKKELPALYTVYGASLKGMDVEVVAVAKAVEESLMRDWKKFIRENGLDWVNMGLTKTVYEEARTDATKFIPRHTTLESLNYADTYDVYSTPKVFLLDGERRIVGKQLTPEQMVDLVQRLQDAKARK